MRDNLPLVTGVCMLVAAWMAERERSAAGRAEGGGLGFLGLFTGRRRHYTGKGWIAFNLARLLFVGTLVLIIVSH